MTNTKATGMSKVILLHPNDNILVCVAQIRAGDHIDIDGQSITISIDIGVGHKLARHALSIGDKVIRYGAPIGSLTNNVAAGEHVHMHNMKSDYIPSHTRQHQTGKQPT